jgi:hypothetical protein
MKRQFLIASLFASLAFFISCKKTSEKSEWKAQIESNSMASVTEIFKLTDPQKLKEIISANDEIKGRQFVNSTANKIATYFFYKQKIDIREDFIDNPQGIITLGLFYAAKESQSNTQNNYASRAQFASPDMDCFVTAVSTFLGIADARNIWRSIVAGASEETVIAGLKLIGRRVGTIIGVGVMVYSVGRCLDWW